MFLQDYCIELAERLMKYIETIDPKASEEETIKYIRTTINRHHVATNVLLTFSAAFLCRLMTAGQRITRDRLDKILILDDQITAFDITYSLERLTKNGILWGNDIKGYIVPQCFLKKISSG